MENPNVDMIALSEMAVNEIDDGNIKNSKSAIREWAIENEMPREIADEFAGMVYEGYNKYDEGEDEMEYDELEDDFDETNEFEEVDEADDYEDDYEEEYEEDDAREYALKSAIASLSNMEDHIYYQSEEIKVINKSLSVLAEALASIIDMGEHQTEEMNLMKSKLGIMSESPANYRSPVYSDRVANADYVGGNFQSNKKILLKGALKGLLTVNDISLYEQSGKLSDNAREYLLGEREGR